MSIPTPHISSPKADIARVVLMPGDPLRAKYIAEKFMKDFKLVSSVRGNYIYTGFYNGKRISVGGSGIGCPSISIYSYELFNFYDVDTIIRIGSTGSYKKDINVRDVVLATESYTDNSVFSSLVGLEKTQLAKPTPFLNELIEKEAKKLNIELKKGRVHCSDVFYQNAPTEEVIKKTNAICVEMESFSLFVNAKKANKNCACILTVSDSLVAKEPILTSDDRQKTLNDMIKLALTVASKLDLD